MAIDVDGKQKRDRYGRTIGEVWCGEDAVRALMDGTDPGPSVNAMLLKSGHACLYSDYISRSEFGSSAWVFDRPIIC